MTNYRRIPIYDEIWNQPGLRRLRLFTHWFFWEYENGKYDFTKFDEAKMRASLHDESLFFPDEPLVLDQENPTFNASPEGIAWHLRCVKIVREERPHQHVAYYGQLPERSWYTPTDYRQMLEDKRLGLRTWFTINEKQLTADYDAWKARCRVFDPVAQAVDSIHPSIYSLKPGRKAQPIWYPVKASSSGWLKVLGYRLSLGNTVQFNAAGPLPKPLLSNTSYRVIQVQGANFQIAMAAGEPPIKLLSEGWDRIYVADLGPYTRIEDDPNTRAWGWYAEEMIQQARTYSKPVYVWVSPTEKGVGTEWLDPKFFEWQLNKVAPLVDGIVVFHSYGKPSLVRKQAAWSRPLVLLDERINKTQDRS